MLIKTQQDIPSSEVTPEILYRHRRKFLRTSAVAIAGAAAYSIFPETISSVFAQDNKTWKPSHPSSFDTSEELTSLQ